MTTVKEAFTLADRLHEGQTRKGGSIPYLSHLLQVAGLVMEMQGTDDEVIAAFLHDAPEDQGGHETLAKISEQFGPNVARIVGSCSDTLETPKPSWRGRKERHLAELEYVDDGVLRVVLADKLHNARSLKADLDAHGKRVWGRFNSDPDSQLWYYSEMAALLLRRLGHDQPSLPYINELVYLVTDIWAEVIQI